MVKTTRTASIDLGTGACYSVGSDRYPATVIAKTPSTIIVQDDNFTAGEGHNYFGAQVWNFSPNLNGRTMVCRWSAKRNAWVNGGRNIHVGARGAYQNPSF